MLDAVRHISRSRLLLMRCGFLAGLGQQERQQALHDIDLLIAIQAAGEASPEDPPVDFVLRLIAELRARRRKCGGPVRCGIRRRCSRSRGADRSRRDSASGLRAPRCVCGFRSVRGRHRRGGARHRPARSCGPGPARLRGAREVLRARCCRMRNAARTSSQAASTASWLTTAAGRARRRVGCAPICAAGTADASGSR